MSMDETMNTSAAEASETMGADSGSNDYWPDDVSDIIAAVGGTDDEDGAYDTAESTEAAETEDAEAESKDGDGENAPEKADAEGTGNEEPAAEQTPETFTLKHLDNTYEVNREQVTTLAQKGLDHDRLRGKLDEAKAEYDELKSWLETVSGGQKLEDFRDMVDARRIAQQEGIDEKTALARVKIDRERRALEAEKSRAQNERQRNVDANAENERRRADVAAFVKAFPDVAAKSQTDKNAIPAEVWDKVNKGETLVNAYTAYKAKQDSEAKDKRIAELEAALEAEKQTKKNAARSTGSQKSAGGDPPYDPIAAGWDSV